MSTEAPVKLTGSQFKVFTMQPTSCVFIAHGLEDTDRLGELLAEVLPDGTTVGLCGTLGAGKTRLVQGIAAACGIPRESVVSPTFVLCQEYHGSRTIFHLDAYRLQDAEEFRQLGPQEYFESTGLTFVEWSDRVQEVLPNERIEIHIDVEEGDRRRFEIFGYGKRMDAAVKALAGRFA